MSQQAAVAGRGGRSRLLRGGLIGLSLLYVALLLVAPFAGILWIALKEGFGAITETLSLPDVKHAFYLTLVITVMTVAITSVFGVLTAWVLVRHRFVGRGFVNALVDLPFAVSPVIVGLTAIIMFGRGGWFEPFLTTRGIDIIFALPSMVLVTIFICIPFVIRGVVPILVELGVDEEEAAKTLGASPFKTFWRVTLPNIRWGLMYGIALSTARALGEVGAVLIVSGSIQGQTETATLYILRALEERQETQGYLVALTLAAASIAILLGIEFLKNKRVKEQGA